MFKILLDWIGIMYRPFSDERRRGSRGKLFRLNTTRSYRVALSVACNLLLAVVMLNPFAVRAQTTEIVASGLWNVVTYYPYCNYTELGTVNFAYANGTYSGTTYTSNRRGFDSSGKCQNTGPQSQACAGFYQSGQDLLSASQFQAMIAAMAVSCGGQGPNIQSVSFTSPDSVAVTIIDPEPFGSFSVQMTRAASTAVDMTGTWTATLNGTIFKGDSVEGQTTWLTLTIVQSGSNVSVTSGFSDTLGRSGSWAGTWSISGNTMDAWYSIDPDPACASRTFTHTITVTSTAPDQMTDTATAPASGICPAQSASVVYTKQAAPTPTSYALDVTGTGSGYGSVSSSPAGISCYVPEPGTYYLVAPDCTESYASGTSVTLAANPSAGSFFAGWRGDCSGTSSCSVTMSAARNVTAIFKPVPFVATTTSTITATSATISTNITFSAADAGKQGSVFITAWAPANGLGAFGILSASLSKALSVTTTRDNPYLGNAVNSRQETLATLLAATDPNAFVLIQRTASGWQLVQNGQLIPYASGVLGDALSSLSILNNTNPSNLIGAQFCVGYGSSAADMIKEGRMIPVASIPGSSTTSNGSCNVALAPYMGLWWNSAESGWGMNLTQHGSTIANSIYTYDGTGQPTWYSMACTLAGAICTGDIYKVSGGTSPAVAWNGAGVVRTNAGSGTLTFADIDNGTFTYTIDSLPGSKSVARLVFASGSAPSIDYTDLWWNPSESGWGVALTQQYGTIAAAWYSYDAAGKADWYVGTCTVSGSSCAGDLLQVTGGAPLTGAWHATNAPTKVGTLSFAFTDANNGTMSYAINGVTESRTIKRLSF